MLHKPYFCNVVIKNVSCTLYDFNCEQLSHTDDVEVLKTHKDTQLDLKGSIISRPKGKKKKTAARNKVACKNLYLLLMRIRETHRRQTINKLELLLLFAHRDLQRIVRMFSGNLVYQQTVILYLLIFSLEHVPITSYHGDVQQ